MGAVLDCAVPISILEVEKMKKISILLLVLVLSVLMVVPFGVSAVTDYSELQCIVPNSIICSGTVNRIRKQFYLSELGGYFNPIGIGSVDVTDVRFRDVNGYVLGTAPLIGVNGALSLLVEGSNSFVYSDGVEYYNLHYSSQSNYYTFYNQYVNAVYLEFGFTYNDVLYWSVDYNAFYSGSGFVSNKVIYSNVFLSVYDIGYNAGYADGETAGYADGETAGYADGEIAGYNAGYSDGLEYNGLTDYNTGYNAGYSAGLNTQSVTSWFVSLLGTMGTILNINLLGNIKIIHLVAIPLIFGAVFLVLKFIK